MFHYPSAVAKIADDYLDRVRERLGSVPAAEQDEFLRELSSHIYEAYAQASSEDGVTKMLAVLRKIGDPAEVVSDRLPAAMLRSGTQRSLPLYIAGAALIALFGIPLGFGGFAALLGILVAFAGVLIGYYAATGAFLFAGGLIAAFGLIRIALPSVWDNLVSAGFIRMDDPVQDFLARFPAFEQGILILLVSAPLMASGLVLLRGGKYLIRGLRFLFLLLFDAMRRFAQSVRRRLRRSHSPTVTANELSFS